MAQGRKIDSKLIVQIEMLAGSGFGATEIHDSLSRQYKSIEVPDIRTVQKYVSNFRNRKDDEPWSLHHTDGLNSEDAKSLLLAYKELIPSFKPGKVLTVGEARWLVRVLKVAQGLGPIKAFYLAREYLSRERGGSNPPDYSDLDAFLVFQPWNKENLDSYRRAIENKQVIPVSGWNHLLESSIEQIRTWSSDANKVAFRLGTNYGTLHQRVVITPAFEEG